MRKKLGIALGIIITLIIVAFLVAGNYFYNQAVKRGTEVVLHKENVSLNALASEEDQVYLKEAKKWYDDQQPEIVSVETDEGIRIHSQFIAQPTPEQKGVVLVHGFRSTGGDMGKLAKFYYDQGFDVLLPDARGHGDSEGDYIGFGWHDRMDILQWVDFLTAHGDEQIILHGNSMGAATVLMASGEELPVEVRGIVADSSYSSVKEELAHQLKHIYNLPAFPLLEVTSFVTKLRAGYTFGEASVVNQVKKNTRPVFIIHGDADDLVPTEMAQQIYGAANGDKDLWIVPDAGHVKAYDNVTMEFERRLQTFLDSVMKE
ncbi:alpha/beta fold hydrolase [Sporosarcina sp. Sa2YVA2]|uniref:Alpha/beta fold hydrolase n=1 Tax=Sporosarcina quadrami TaxID=2762234 RepID=A0ABR8UA78_9BACL|nr:alpha/beta fold hydrolase [Sporosarcina quadrami]MBD7984938.1 alpha/beta fold hydrolase [Sporosarcina quadrami]